MSSPPVSVVIVNFNGRRYLTNCLASLSRQTFQDFEVIVVDNASEDGSVELIEGQGFEFVRFLRNPENFGFARANNQGIEESRGKFLITLNNDTEADERWLEELITAAETATDVGMVASRIALLSDRGRLDSAGMVVYSDLLARQRGRLEPAALYPLREEVLLPSACAALYRREMLAEIGLFDEDFFAYCEDTELGLRGRLWGWRCLYAPGAVVYHAYSGTAGPYSERKAYLVERNRLWTVFKLLPLPLLLLSPVSTLLRYFYQGYGAIMGRGSSGQFVSRLPRSRLLHILLKANWDGLRALPRLLPKRRLIQREKRLSTWELYRMLRRYRISAKEIAFQE